MERRNFLKKAGLVMVGATFIPSVVLGIKKENPKYIAGVDVGHKNGDCHHIVVTRNNNETYTYIDGKIDEKAVWNRMLTNKEIKTLFHHINYPLHNNETINLWL